MAILNFYGKNRMRDDLKKYIQGRDIDKLRSALLAQSMTTNEVIDLCHYAIKDNYWQAVVLLASQLTTVKIKLLKKAVIALAKASEWESAIGLAQQFPDDAIHTALLAKAIKNGDDAVLSNILVGITISPEVKLKAFIVVLKLNRLYLLSFFVEDLSPQERLVITSTQDVVKEDDPLFNQALFYLFCNGPKNHELLALAVKYRLTMLVEYLCALPDYSFNINKLITCLDMAYENKDSAIVSALINRLQPIITPVEFLYMMVSNLDIVRFQTLYPSPLSIDTLTEALDVLAENDTKEHLQFAVSLMREGAITPALIREKVLEFSSNGLFLSESDKDLLDGILQNPVDIEDVLSDAVVSRQWDFITWFAPLINKEIGLDKSKILGLLLNCIPNGEREAFEALFSLSSTEGVMTIFEKVVKEGRFILMPVMFRQYEALRVVFESHFLAKVSPDNDFAITHIPDTVLNVTLVERLCRSLSTSHDYARLKLYIANLDDSVLIECLHYIKLDRDEHPVKWEIIRLLLPRLSKLFAQYRWYSLLNGIICRAGLTGNFDIAETLYIENLPMMVSNNDDANRVLSPFVDNNQIDSLKRICEKIKIIPGHESYFLNVFHYFISSHKNPAITALFAEYLTTQQVAYILNRRDETMLVRALDWSSEVTALSALTGDNKPSQSTINQSLVLAARGIPGALQVLCSMTTNNKPSWFALFCALSVARQWNDLLCGSNEMCIDILKSSFEPNLFKATFFGSGRKRSHAEIEYDERVDEFWDSRPGC